MELLTKEQLWKHTLRHEPTRAQRRGENGAMVIIALAIGSFGLAVSIGVLWALCIVAGACQ